MNHVMIVTELPTQDVGVNTEEYWEAGSREWTGIVWTLLLKVAFYTSFQHLKNLL